ncbi:MAG: LCP family protein [Bacteroidota bacterium]
MKIRKIILLSMIFIILGIIIYVAYLGYKITNTIEETYRDTELKQRNDRIPNTGDKLISVLLLGIEQRGLDDAENIDDPGRSDAILLLLFNTNTGKITALSIPRDTRVHLQKEDYAKLTDVYAYGPEVSITLIEDLLKFPVDYYIAFSEKAFADFIDMMGGVTIDVKKENAERMEVIDEGKQRLDGNTTLYYIRFRNDSEGDFGRMSRLQQVIDTTMHQAINIKTFIHLNRYINIVKQNIRHNIPMDSMKKEAPHLTSCSPDNFEKLSMEGKNVEIDSLWYVIPKFDNLLNIRKKLRLELKESKDRHD